MNNIILIGMPGCGKSTLGVILAKTIGYSFLDTDLVIQEKVQEKLYKIIGSHGIERFVALESSVIKTITVNKTVIATGGSVVLEESEMRHLSSLGTIVYLKLPEYEIEKRIYNINTRGIVMEKNETIADIYSARTPLYEKYADVTVDLQGLDTEEALGAVINQLNIE